MKKHLSVCPNRAGVACRHFGHFALATKQKGGKQMDKIISAFHSSFEAVKSKYLNEVNEEATNKETIMAFIQAASILAVVEEIHSLTNEVYEIKYQLEKLNK